MKQALLVAGLVLGASSFAASAAPVGGLGAQPIADNGVIQVHGSPLVLPIY